ncbi:MAG: purine-nucleoside phosphorylase [Pyrinomonadaceae bacterium]
MYERAQRCAEFIRSRIMFQPKVALVLGSGLGGFADDIETATSIPYESIPGFMRSTVEGHTGRLVAGSISGVPVIAMCGRFHYYEGYSLDQVTFPIRVFGLFGIKKLILTNAAGGVNAAFDRGLIMIIKDHINLIGENPLRGSNESRFGPRFPDMSEVYAREIQEIAFEEACQMQLDVRRGVYAALQGPSYETPAEIYMLRLLGADAVGMSTVPEAIVAGHMGMKVLGLSCITNMAAGVLEEPINHTEVIETGIKVRAKFGELLQRVISRLS